MVSTFLHDNGGYPRRVVDNIELWPHLLKAYSSSNPVKVLAEGDSWLAYPEMLQTKNITCQLADANKETTVLLLCIASSGDEAVTMMSHSDNKKAMLGALQQYDFDVLLFSGGGNDIVGRYDFDFFLKYKDDGMSWQECILTDRLKRRILQIKNAYLDLLEYVFQYSKNQNIRVVTHTYDNLTPSPKGLFKNESWLYPFLKNANITDKNEQVEVVKHVMGMFVEMLKEVKESTQAQKRFIVVETNGLVKPNEWVNEIHPNASGFKKVADRIYEQAIKR